MTTPSPTELSRLAKDRLVCDYRVDWVREPETQPVKETSATSQTGHGTLSVKQTDSERG